MAWELHKLSSGKNSLDNFELGADAIWEVHDQLKAYFQERLQKGSKFGLDIALSAVGFEIFIDGARITVGWDNWSGMFIMAWDEDGNVIVEELAQFFNADS